MPDEREAVQLALEALRVERGHQVGPGVEPVGLDERLDRPEDALGQQLVRADEDAVPGQIADPAAGGEDEQLRPHLAPRDVLVAHLDLREPLLEERDAPLLEGRVVGRAGARVHHHRGRLLRRRGRLRVPRPRRPAGGEQQARPGA
ncbi:MAG TPA: hypothetical protein VNK05_07765, partial [Chloroflexota bacterium]|nr:hypothetical protein [Chloroflexota bacterium]